MNKEDYALIAFGLIVLVTFPLWVIPGVIYMIVTGQSPRTLGEQANQLSEVDE